jgi:hypothetical protein
VGDFNGDGVSDLVVAARDANEVVGHSGNGVAGFGAAVTLLTCTKPIGVALADIDNNDLLDLVAVYLSTPSTTTLQPLLGNGAGAFTPQSTSSFDAGDKGPVNMALVDLCGIGRLDACLGAGGKPVLLVNDGAGRYQPKASLITILGLMDVGGGSNLSLPVDLNHDGRLDLVYSAVGGPSNKNQLAMAPTLPPPGVQSLSNGTPGCTGIHGIVADVKATSGRSFIVSSKNAPPSSLGLVLATDAVNLTGIDPFGLGILLFTDFFNSSYVAAYDVVSDRNGSAAALVDVPAAPSLVGQSLYTQLLFAWYGTGCTPSTYTLSSSRALVSTVFP